MSKQAAALEIAARQFRMYEEQHRAKGTEEADRKAAVNQAMAEMIKAYGRSYRKFIPWPEPVNDRTVRCIACGQIDEPEFHDDKLCPGMRPPPHRIIEGADHGR